MPLELNPQALDANDGYKAVLERILGKHAGKTPEQIVTQYPFDFYRKIVPCSLFPRDWRNRIRLVDHATKHYEPQIRCGCGKPSQVMIVYRHGGASSTSRLYCSRSCKAVDELVRGELQRGEAWPTEIGLYTLEKERPFRLKRLIQVIAENMGINSERRWTKQYLHDAFDNITLTQPFVPEPPRMPPKQPRRSPQRQMRGLFD